jgi:hypothetical protein
MTTLVAAPVLLELRRTLAGADSMGAWTALRQQYGVGVSYAFSRPVVAEDLLSALVFYALTCGPQCGESGFVWLTRSSQDSRWSVAKQLPVAIS